MKNFSKIPVLILTVAMVAAAGCGGYSSPPNSYNSSGGASTAYVSNPDPSIYGYATANSSSYSMSNSSGTLTSTVNGPSGDVFIGLATDAGGNLYTVDQSTAGGSTSYTVNEYAASSNSTGGAVTATMRTFTSTAINAQPTGVSVDGSGNVYVMLTGGTLLRFTAGATGAATPAVTLSGLATAMATDQSGNLYVTVPVSLTDSHNMIAVYGAGYATGTLALRTIIPATEMNIASLSADASGNLYASGKDSNGNAEVAVFSAVSTGTASATRVIAGSNTHLINPWQVQVDGAGNVFVGDSTTGSVGGTDVVYEFASTATGNVSPTATITTSATYAVSTGMAIH